MRLISWRIAGVWARFPGVYGEKPVNHVSKSLCQVRTVCPPPKETPAGIARNSPRLWCKHFAANKSMLLPSCSTSCITSAAALMASLHCGSSGRPTKTAMIRSSLSNTNRVLLEGAACEKRYSEVAYAA